MNGPQSSKEEKSASWQEALFIDLASILFLHCHQVSSIDKERFRGTLFLNHTIREAALYDAILFLNRT